jgi:hypothetical protein
MEILYEAFESGRAEFNEFFSGIAWPQKQSLRHSPPTAPAQSTPSAGDGPSSG